MHTACSLHSRSARSGAAGRRAGRRGCACGRRIGGPGACGGIPRGGSAGWEGGR